MSEYRGGVHRGRRKHDGFDENMGPIHFGLERKSDRRGGKKGIGDAVKKIQSYLLLLPAAVMAGQSYFQL